MTSLAAEPKTLHGSLIEALNAGDPERALEQAFIQLARGGSLALVLAMIKALVRSGLGGIAVRLLRSAGGFLAAEPQLTALAEQLQRVPSGEIPSSTLESNFSRNCETIRSRPDSRCDCFGADGCGAEFRVYQSAKGNIHILRESDSGKLDFVFPFIDQVAQAQATKWPAPSLSSAYLLVGVPTPAVWRSILSLRTIEGYRPPVDIVETDVNVLRMWLSLADLVSDLQNDRVALFCGECALDNYRAYLTSHPTRQPATECLTNLRPRWQPPVIDRQFGEQLVRAAADQKCRRKAELDGVYADRDSAYWRRRFVTAGDAGPPLRVVGLTSRYSTVMQHAMRDLAAAFVRLGCQFEVVRQTSDSAASVDVIGQLSAHQPDLVVVINHARCKLTDSIPDNVPYVCWIQDYMQELWDRRIGATIGELDLVLGHSPDVMSSVYGYPRDKFLPTNNLTSSDVFSVEPVDPRQLEKYRCDISYVGHGSAPPSHLIRELSAGDSKVDQYLSAIAELARGRLSVNGFLTTQDLVDVVIEGEIASSCPPLTPHVRRTVIVPSAQRIIDRIVRHEALEWASKWASTRHKRFRIFGRGWESHPTLRNFAGGELEHGEELRCVYQASTISLQINSYCSLHQRLLDGLAAGAFMLSRYIPADFIREPLLYIQEFISEQRITTLTGLMKRTASDQRLAQAIRDAERLTGTRIAPCSDAVRARHARSHIECESLPAADFSDDGLFSLLKSAKAVPHRAAGDIFGFDRTTFRSERELHDMLDRFSNDASARKSIAEPMRKSVLANDTFDGLAQQILAAFQQRWNRSGG